MGAVLSRGLPPASLAWLVWGLGACLYLLAFYQRVAPAVITQGGKTIWLSGMTGGGASGGTFESKARAAFETIQKTLAENGASLKDLVSLKVFIKAAPVNSNDFAKVMRDLFPDGKYPASTVVTVSYSPELIEIQGVAVVAS